MVGSKNQIATFHYNNSQPGGQELTSKMNNLFFAGEDLTEDQIMRKMGDLLAADMNSQSSKSGRSPLSIEAKSPL